MTHAPARASVVASCLVTRSEYAVDRRVPTIATVGRSRSERSPRAQRTRGGLGQSSSADGYAASPRWSSTSGQLDVANWLDVQLSHLQQPAPPRLLQRIEAGTRSRADSVHAERVGCLDRRGLVLAKQVHLGEDHA